MGQLIFDQYSLLHFSQGVAAYFWGADPLTWLVSHALFEFAENSEPGMAFINEYITFWPGGKPEADSWMNILGDNISAQAGYWCAKYLDEVGKKRGWYKPPL